MFKLQNNSKSELKNVLIVENKKNNVLQPVFSLEYQPQGKIGSNSNSCVLQSITSAFVGLSFLHRWEKSLKNEKNEQKPFLQIVQKDANLFTAIINIATDITNQHSQGVPLSFEEVALCDNKQHLPHYLLHMGYVMFNPMIAAERAEKSEKNKFNLGDYFAEKKLPLYDIVKDSSFSENLFDIGKAVCVLIEENWHAVTLIRLDNIHYMMLDSHADGKDEFSKIGCMSIFAKNEKISLENFLYNILNIKKHDTGIEVAAVRLEKPLCFLREEPDKFFESWRQYLKTVIDDTQSNLFNSDVELDRMLNINKNIANKLGIVSKKNKTVMACCDDDIFIGESKDILDSATACMLNLICGCFQSSPINKHRNSVPVQYVSYCNNKKLSGIDLEYLNEFKYRLIKECKEDILSKERTINNIARVANYGTLASTFFYAILEAGRELMNRTILEKSKDTVNSVFSTVLIALPLLVGLANGIAALIKKHRKDGIRSAAQRAVDMGLEENGFFGSRIKQEPVKNNDKDVNFTENANEKNWNLNFK